MNSRIKNQMQKLDINRNGINGWYCNTCKIYNDILTIRCAYGCELRDESLAAIAIKIRLRRDGTLFEIEQLQKLLNEQRDK